MTNNMPAVDANGALQAKMRVAGYPVRIYPPTGGKPYHQIAYELEGKRFVTSGGKTLKSALVKVGKIQERLDSKATRSTVPVSTLLDEWLHPSDEPHSWSLKYTRSNEWLVRTYVRPSIGSVICQDLRREDVVKAVKAAPTAGEGQRLKRLLSSALRWGDAYGYLTTSPDKLLHRVVWSKGGSRGPAKVREQGRDELGVHRGSIPTHEAVASLAKAFGELEGSDPWWSLAPLVAAYSGVRLGELLALRAEDVDIRGRTISVRRQWLSIPNEKSPTAPKGRKIRETIFRSRSPVTATYPKGFDIAGQLAKHVARMEATNPSGLLFPAPRGGYWSHSNFYRRKFHPAASAAGWPTTKVHRVLTRGKPAVELEKLNWTWHSLRHVFCSYYLWELGAAAADVSRAAGHSSVDITLRIYSSEPADSLDRLRSL